MAARYVLVLDAGTSGARSLVFDRDARIVGSCSSVHDYLVEEDAPYLARAYDPRALWNTFCRLIQGSLRDAGIEPGQVSAVSATSQRQAVVFLDGAGREIYAGPNLDLRAVFEGAAIDEEMRERVYRTTGHLPSLFFTPAKLRWFQNHRPEAYVRIAGVLTLADWLVWRLTGVLVGEPSLAGEAGLLDIHRRQWCTDLLADLGLAANDHPLAQAGTMAGCVATAAAAETGLSKGTPVAVSGADTQCGLLGLGVAAEHQVGVVAGWSVPLQMVTTKPVLSPEARTWAGCFLESGKWVLESGSGDAGNSYRWLAKTLFGGGDGAFGAMDELAAAVPAGSEGASAFLGPARMDMASLGMRPGGIFFPVPLTFSDMGRGQLVRATLEGMAFAIKANLEQIEELEGVRATDVSVGGGMTRTRTFARVLVDVLGRPIDVSPTPQVSALGAYLCARTALGDFGSLEEAALRARSPLRRLEPDPLDSAEYQDQYMRWIELSGQVRKLSL